MLQIELIRRIQAQIEAERDIERGGGGTGISEEYS